MTVGKHWNPNEETVREIVALIDSMKLDIKELKELRQIKSPNQHFESQDQFRDQQIQMAFRQENTEPSTEDLGKDSDACNVFDKMLNGKIEAKLNLDANSGSQEKLGDSLAIKSQSGSNFDRKILSKKPLSSEDSLSRSMKDYIPRMKVLSEQMKANFGQIWNEDQFQSEFREESNTLDFESEIVKEPEELTSSKKGLEMTGECLKTASSSLENLPEEPLSGESSSELISVGNRLSNFSVDSIGICHELSEKVADFGRSSMGSLRIFRAYQPFEEITFGDFNVSDASKSLKSWSFDPGGTENWDFVALTDKLGFVKFDLRPILVVDSMGSKQPLVNAEIVWIETLLALHVGGFVELPSFGSIDSNSSLTFDPGGYFREVVLGLPKCVDKGVCVQVSHMFEDSICANLGVELKWVIQGIISFSQKSVALQQIVLAANSSFPYDRGKFVIENWIYLKCFAEPMWIIQANASSKNDEVGMGSVLLQFWTQVHLECEFQQGTSLVAILGSSSLQVSAGNFAF